jgi:hypothetical protein
MKRLILFLSAIVITGTAAAQNSACGAATIYPNTTCGTSATTFNNFNNTMEGTSAVNPGCTTDDETTQSVTWVQFTATATSVTITNNTNYAGPGAADIEDKDFVLYSGTCSTLTQVACAATVQGSGGTTTFTGLTVGQTYFIMASRSANSIAAGCATCNNLNFCVTSTVAATVPANPCNTCTSPCNLTTNTTYNYTTLNATADAFICSGSVENNTWYQWCAPATWPVGQQAYISINSQFCNSSSGLQLTVWNIGATCPTAATNTNLVCQNPGSTTNYYYQWTAVAGTCYRITVDGFGGTACSFNLTVGSVIVLPIELLTFQAVNRHNMVYLDWVTASENNNDYFTVERTVDGMIFEEVARQDAAGTSSRMNRYSALDREPANGISYYRLKQTDFNGNMSYSSLVAVETKEELYDMVIYPNPSVGKDEADIVYTSYYKGKGALNIYDAVGRLVKTQDIECEEGANTLSIDLCSLKKGVYFISIVTNGQLLRSKYLKS